MRSSSWCEIPNTLTSCENIYISHMGPYIKRWSDSGWHNRPNK